MTTIAIILYVLGAVAAYTDRAYDDLPQRHRMAACVFWPIAMAVVIGIAFVVAFLAKFENSRLDRR